MKAISYPRYGGAETLEISDRPDPVAASGDVVVAIAYASVNPLDWKLREGWMDGLMALEFPVIPGCDGAGTILGIGDDVADFSPGDRVFFYSKGTVIHDGTYAERIAVPAQHVAHVPEGLDLASAAAVPVAALTAWQALHDFAAVKAGETVLITAGAGGVGSYALQLAEAAGATVLGTASEANHPYMTQLGADHAIDYRQSSVSSAVRALVPEGCDVVFDCAGGESYDEGARSLKPGGRIATIVRPPNAGEAAEGGYKAAFIPSMPSGEQLATIAGLIAAGSIQLPQIAIHSVRDAAAAQDLSQAGHTRGKLVLKIDF